MVQYNRSDSGFQDLMPSEQQLVDRALWCVNRGFAPPAEIYRVEHRSKIDWGRFPSWARPVNPEAFEGCCHEG